ncbi:DUF4143 domain-containing protein [Otoolea muris]|uniref:DUF4143 domain-containing protein n=1 Tax=Otoolea muris TaxID=2941515 RepID=UPI0023B8BA2A|nr:DUF4143 domain-containing protein [Otoolea muris]
MNCYFLRHSLNRRPAQLQKHEKKFRLSSLKKQARFRDYEDALFWLDDAMIVNICYNSTSPNIGLKLNMDRMTLKCYMGDTGLLISHAFDENGIVSEELYKKLLFDKLEVNKGMITENIVAQMLAASGHKLYFYSNPSRSDSADRRFERGGRNFIPAAVYDAIVVSAQILTLLVKYGVRL